MYTWLPTYALPSRAKDYITVDLSTTAQPFSNTF